MRLTKKDIFKGKHYGYDVNVPDTDYEKETHMLSGTCLKTIINKLGQYEDIEDELDIDLITFSKLLKALDRECVYVKVKKTKQCDGYSINEETGEIRRCVVARFSRYINGLRDWFFTISFGCSSSVDHYLLKDYGKTWALTKEELE